jgi:hypothetical protein
VFLLSAVRMRNLYGIFVVNKSSYDNVSYCSAEVCCMHLISAFKVNLSAIIRTFLKEFRLTDLRC